MEFNSLLPVIIVLLGLLFMGAPVSVALGGSGLLGLWLLLGARGLDVAIQTAATSLNSFVLIAVPLFIAMGVFLAEGGIGERLYNMFDVMLRHIPGGVGIATVLTCAVLAAMCGTSVAIAGMVGAFALKNMRRLGYSLPLSMGTVVGGGALGMLIPPSLPMIVYGAIAQESVGKLFICGIGPGIVAVILFCGWVYVAFRKEKGGKVAPPATWSERWKAFKNGFWGLLIPLIIIVLLYWGIATPTEIAALGCAISLFVVLFVYRSVSIKGTISLLRRAVSSSVMILFIIVGALILAKFVTQAGVARAVADIFVGRGIPTWGFLLITMAIILCLGCLMEGASLMLLLLPILITTVRAYNYDPYVYGVLLVINIECAMLTPPVGLNLYAVDGIAKAQGLPSTLGTTVRGSFPFLIAYLVVMVLVAIFPQIALWVPHHLFNF